MSHENRGHGAAYRHLTALALTVWTLAGCGGGGSNAGPPAPAPALPQVTHDWRLAVHLTNGTTVDLPTAGSSTGVDVDEVIDLGSLMVSPPCCEPKGFAGVTATADGRRYGAGAAAPLGDTATPTSPIGSMAHLEQVQTLRKTSDTGTLELVVSRSRIELMDYDANVPTTLECPNRYLTTIEDIFAAGGLGCGDLIEGRLTFQVLAWKEVPIVDADGVVRGYGKVDLAHGSTLTTLGGYLKTTDRDRGIDGPGNWHESWGPSGDSNLQFKVGFDYHYDPCVQPVEGNDFNCSRAQLYLNRSMVISIPLDAVNLNEEFKLVVLATADVNNRRQLETYAGAFFRDPQGEDGVSIAMQGVEVVAQPRSADVTPPPATGVPVPACTGGADPAAGSLQFAAAQPFVSEATRGGVAYFWVTRSGGAKGTVSARMSTRDGTARSGVDYQAVSTLVRFEDGEQGQRFVAIPIINNTVVDHARTVTLELSELGGCGTLGAQASSTLTIRDDDAPPPDVHFSIGGTVSGLVGTGLVLRDVLGGGSVAPQANGAFVLSTTALDGSAYDVQVQTQPDQPAQNCVVTNGSGTVAHADVDRIGVICSTVAAGGSLDTAFGSGGKVSSTAPSAKALARQADGKILAVGGMVLSRFNADGTPDTTFGSGGRVTVVANGGPLDALQAVAVQPDGRIVVAGMTSLPTVSNDDFAILRFNSDGSPDSSFNGNGKVMIDFAGLADRAYAVLVQADGGIVAAGFATSGTLATADQDVAVVRVLANGTLDAGFGTGGKATVNVAGKGDFGSAMALQADGRIVVAGRVASDGGANPDFGIVRLQPNGVPDAGFGSNGIARLDFGGAVWDEAADVAIQRDGAIVIGGFTQTAGAYRFALARLTAAGLPDPAFGAGGLVSTPFTGSGDFGRALALQADGRIVVVGQVGATTVNPDIGIARYLTTGALDTTFGANGLVQVDFFGAIDNANDVLVQPDGHIVAAGSARNGGTTGLGLVRVLP